MDITQDLTTLTQTMLNSFRQYCAVVQLASQITLPINKTPHILRQASVIETSTAFTVLNQRRHLESLTRTNPS